MKKSNDKIIIHLEDDEAVRMTMKMAFSKFLGCKVLQFYSPSEVSENLYAEACVIVSDFDMVDGTALDMLTILKDNHIKTPVILHSGEVSNYIKIKELNLCDNIVLWANKSTPVKNIIDEIKKFL